MSVHKNQELLTRLATAYDAFLPFYRQLNSLNRSKNLLEGYWALGISAGTLLGIPLAIHAFRLSNQISSYVHSFYVDDGPFPFFLFAPLWVEILLFLGGLIMIILSVAVPISVIYCIVKRINRNRYIKTNEEIAATWNKLRASIAGWSECPVTLEYSHPQWITAIYNAINIGRADSVMQAIHILEEDERHRQLMNAQIEAQRAYLEKQNRIQQRSEAIDDLVLLFWLSEI